MSTITPPAAAADNNIPEGDAPGTATTAPLALPLPEPPPTAAANPNPANNRNGANVRDRLFHVMLVKMAISYNRRVPYALRRVIEFLLLMTALSLLCLLMYIHFHFNRMPGTCLDPHKETWPRRGVVRVEVVQNLEEFRRIQALYQQEQQQKGGAPPSDKEVTHFSLKELLQRGPDALPKELKSPNPAPSPLMDLDYSSAVLETHRVGRERLLLSQIMQAVMDSALWLWDFFFNLDDPYLISGGGDDTNEEEEAVGHSDLDELSFPPPAYVYVVEYSLHYGLLKLSTPLRDDYRVPVLLVQLDADSTDCFGDWSTKALMKHLVGYEEVVMSSVRALAENETEKGYLRDLISGEHYHFINVGTSRASYFTALIVMMIFTFAISMLLRFSHQQIFLFIVDLLQMFELNQPLIFPVAPLLTVILALVGMEAIMSEIFNDTSIAFYMILLVWVADQYDAICCHSSIGKRLWLRFFYVYHFAFYVYQYKYNGQYGGLALLTSTTFILHSMVFFFHHYEMPLILYQERLQYIVNNLQHGPIINGGGGGGALATATLRVSIRMPSATAAVASNVEEEQVEERPSISAAPAAARDTGQSSPRTSAAAEAVAEEVVTNAMVELAL